MSDPYTAVDTFDHGMCMRAGHRIVINGEEISCPSCKKTASQKKEGVLEREALRGIVSLCREAIAEYQDSMILERSLILQAQARMADEVLREISQHVPIDSLS